MNVAGRNGFVSALQSLVAVSSVAPLSKVLHYVDYALSENLRADWEKINVGTWLLWHWIFKQLLVVLLVNVAFLPVKTICKEFIKLRSSSRDVITVGIYQMTVIVEVRCKHENAVVSHVLSHRHISINIGLSIWKFVENFWLYQIARRYERNVPNSANLIVDDCHVIAGSGVEALVADSSPEVTPYASDASDNRGHKRFIERDEFDESVEIFQVYIGVNDKEIIALLGQAAIDGQFSCCRLTDSIFKIESLDWDEFLISSVFQERISQLRMIFHVIVHEQVNFVFRVVQSQDFVEEFLKERRGCLHKQRNQHSERFLFIFRNVVFQACHTLAINKSSRKVISKIVQN